MPDAYPALVNSDQLRDATNNPTYHPGVRLLYERQHFALEEAVQGARRVEGDDNLKPETVQHAIAVYLNHMRSTEPATADVTIPTNQEQP